MGRKGKRRRIEEALGAFSVIFELSVNVDCQNDLLSKRKSLAHTAVLALVPFKVEFKFLSGSC